LDGSGVVITFLKAIAAECLSLLISIVAIDALRATPSGYRTVWRLRSAGKHPGPSDAD
jgi:hypothetical protein